MEKNYFAAVDFWLGLVLAGSLWGLLVLSILIAGIMAGTAAGLFAALSPLLAIVPAAILAHRLNWSWFSAALVPFMFPVFLYTLLNSTIVTLRQDGVLWRDTFYSLESLRAGTVRQGSGRPKSKRLTK